MKVTNHGQTVLTFPVEGGKTVDIRPGETVDGTKLDRKSSFVKAFEHSGTISFGKDPGPSLTSPAAAGIVASRQS